MCIDLVKGRTWLQSLNTTAKCGTILLCHISPFRISHLQIPPPPPAHEYYTLMLKLSLSSYLPPPPPVSIPPRGGGNRHQLVPKKIATVSYCTGLHNYESSLLELMCTPFVLTHCTPQTSQNVP